MIDIENSLKRQYLACLVEQPAPCPAVHLVKLLRMCTGRRHQNEKANNKEGNQALSSEVLGRKICLAGRVPQRQDTSTKYSTLDGDTNEVILDGDTNAVIQALSRKDVCEEICLAGRVPQRLDTYTKYSTPEIFFDEAASTTWR